MRNQNHQRTYQKIQNEDNGDLKRRKYQSFHAVF